MKDLHSSFFCHFSAHDENCPSRASSDAGVAAEGADTAHELRRARSRKGFGVLRAFKGGTRDMYGRKWLWLVLLAIVCLVTPAPAQEKAGPSQGTHEGKSADELAKELNNPNNDVAKLSFKFQYRWYEGDLPRADSQDNFTLLFQPVFPFSLGQTETHKSVFFVRPAFPFVFDQPVPRVNNNQLDWHGVSGMGDMVIDASYGRTYKTGWLWLAGLVNTLPTATDNEIAGKQWRMGPEGIAGYIQPWGLLAVFPSHQWDVTGWGGGNYSTTQVQAFAMFTPGGGWAVGTQPIMDYNWEADGGDHWTIPLNLYISKTLVLGKMPFKFDLDLNYYVEQPDTFGPEWMLGFNVTPIVPNYIEQLIRGI